MRHQNIEYRGPRWQHITTKKGRKPTVRKVLIKGRIRKRITSPESRGPIPVEHIHPRKLRTAK